jgi:hypothetical protein
MLAMKAGDLMMHSSDGRTGRVYDHLRGQVASITEMEAL